MDHSGGGRGEGRKSVWQEGKDPKEGAISQ